MATDMPAAGIRHRSGSPDRIDAVLSGHWHPSPNFGPRRDGLRPELIVLHYTAMDCCQRARDWLCTPEAEVSAHYLISERGEVIQMVAEEMRAWHAGAGGWGGSGDVNSRSIGVELANSGAQPFPEPQMVALESLLAGVMSRWTIGPAGVIAHSDCAPGRKTDPGPRFDWRRLGLNGLAVWPESPHAPRPDADEFSALLTRIGYPAAPFETRLAAFRVRTAPARTGPLSARDMALAEAWRLLSDPNTRNPALSV